MIGQPHYPIHLVMVGQLISLKKQRSPMEDVEVVSFLLGCDDNVKLQKLRAPSSNEISSLHLACRKGFVIDNYSNIERDLLMIGVVYDAYPEAIRDETFLHEHSVFHHKVQTFINGELVHARRAEDHRLMSTADERGQLPLHHAVQNNVRLGSICLLVKGNPSAVTSADRNGALPVHLACKCHNLPKVIEHLIDSDVSSINIADIDGNTPLHYACTSARYEVISLLLEKYDSAPVSRLNSQKKLPIELLWESEEASDKDSAEYTESVYRLLRAFPETMST